MFAAALERLLVAEGLETVFVAATLEQARTDLRRHRVDLVLIDINLPDGDGFDLLRERVVPGQAHSWRCVILSSSDEAASVAEAERLGAHGFVSKVAEPRRIVAAVRDAMRGVASFDTPSVRSTEGSVHPLSPRELACLALVAEGLSNREVGEVLGVSAETVKTHMDSVRRKLGAVDRAQATAIGVRLGLI